MNQLCAGRQMTSKIPRNKDQGDMKDRVAVLGNALLASLDDLKSRTDHPVFCVTSLNLSKVPGVLKDRVQAEPAVCARLDNIKKLQWKGQFMPDTPYANSTLFPTYPSFTLA